MVGRTNTEILYRKAKPQDKPYKLSDGRGLYMLVKPNGSKLWRFDYRFGKVRKTLSLGTYPEIKLIDARQRLDAARQLLANKVDPGEAKKAKENKDATFDSFWSIATEWIKKHYNGSNTGHEAEQRLKLYVDKFIGKKDIRRLTAKDFLEVLQRIENRGTGETARRVKSLCSQIMNYAISTDRAENNPLDRLRGALAPTQVKHHAAITDPSKLGDLLYFIEDYQGSLITLYALKISPYVFVRPGELRSAKWEDIDLDRAEWRFTASKTGIQHIVPLATQVVKILRDDLEPLTGDGIYLFPSTRSGGRAKPETLKAMYEGKRCMSENTIRSALRSLGYTSDIMTGHGFRATARTLLDEVLRERIELIEHQLAHTVKDPLGRAYNRTTYLEDRKAMMQRWADYLDGLRESARKRAKDREAEEKAKAQKAAQGEVA